MSILDYMVSTVDPAAYKPAGFATMRSAERPHVTVPHKLSLLSPQARFFRDRTTMVLGFVAGIATGKTFTGSRFVLDHMRRERGRGTLGFVGANTSKQLEQVTLKALWQACDELHLQYGEHYVYNERPPRFWGVRSAFKKHNGVLTMRAWGQAVCQSTTNYDAIRGHEFGWLYIDECRDMSREAWDVLLGRLRCRRASVRIARLTTTPNGYDWLWEYLEEEKQAKGIGDHERALVRMSTFENPHLTDDYLRQLLYSYSPQQVKQELLGMFVNLTAGQVYVAFDRHAHVKAGLKYSADFPLVFCFDFNRTPYCVAVCQTDGQYVQVIDELTMDSATTWEVATELARRWSEKHRGDVYVYGDPMGQHQLSTTSHWSDYDIIQEVFTKAFSSVEMRAGFSAPPVVDRVNAVNAMLMNGMGQRRLFVSPKCRTLIRDFEQVTWHPTQRGQINKTGEVNRLLTHMSDALGYYLADRFPVTSAAVGRVSW